VALGDDVYVLIGCGMLVEFFELFFNRERWCGMM
jgi:hypothetical protein